MMYARSTTISAQPSSIDSGARNMADHTLPTLLDIEGCVGLSLLVNRDTGLCIATSAWDSEAAMRDSEGAMGALRGDASERFGGSIDKVEEWEIAALHRENLASAGACVRCTWLRGPMNAMDQAIHTFKYTVLPQLEELDGFTSASLFMDRASGRAVTATAWDSRVAMEAGRQRASQLRTATTERTGSVLLEIAEFELALAHLRVPELV